MGNTLVYNPWSIIHYIKEGSLGTYWVNTNDHLWLKRLLLQAGTDTQSLLEKLLNGESIEVYLSETTEFPELTQDSSMLWSLLFFTGYLTGTKGSTHTTRSRYTLNIPNLEVRSLLEEIVATWLKQSMNQSEAMLTVHAILEGNAKDVELGLGGLMRDAMSFWDTAKPDPERVYHAFVLGLLVHLQPHYLVRSNRECGFGRTDVMILPIKPGNPGVVLEFKRCQAGDNLQEHAREALNQIHEADYGAELRTHQANPSLALGIAFRGKELAVVGSSS